MGLFGVRRSERWLNGGPGAGGEFIPPNSQVGRGKAGLPSMARAESALRKVAVWSSANLVAGVCSNLPADGFTGSGAAKREVPLPPFFADPDGSGQGLDDWLYQLLMSWLLRGNAYGKILDVDALGRPAQIALHHPDTVAPSLDSKGRVVWRFGGEEVTADKVWHRRMFPMPGRLLGLSPVALHALTIGQGLAAAEFGAGFFADGGHPSAILQQTESSTVDPKQAATVKARFLAATRGQREPVVLGKGWKYEAVQVTPEESQFLDTQRYTSTECARIFGPGLAEVLGYETGGSLTYSNIEQRSLDLLKFTLNRYLRRAETVLSRDVLAQPRWVRFNRGALLETDLLTRYRAHEIALRNEFAVVNEVRELEDRPPVAWGDEPTSTKTPAPLQMETP